MIWQCTECSYVPILIQKYTFHLGQLGFPQDKHWQLKNEAYTLMYNVYIYIFFFFTNLSNCETIFCSSRPSISQKQLLYFFSSLKFSQKPLSFRFGLHSLSNLWGKLKSDFACSLSVSYHFPNENEEVSSHALFSQRELLSICLRWTEAPCFPVYKVLAGSEVCSFSLFPRCLS